MAGGVSGLAEPYAFCFSSAEDVASEDGPEPPAEDLVTSAAAWGRGGRRTSLHFATS
jgi:hypothetical protein